MSLAVLRARVARLVAAERASADLSIDEHVLDAALVFSRRRPRRVVVDLVGTGGWYLPLPADWVPGFSDVLEVEYPAGQRPPAALSPREWWCPYGTPDGEHLAFKELTPPAGATVRVTISAPHLVDEDATTLPQSHWDTIVKLAAGSACLALAAFYSHQEDQTMALDGVRHGSKAGEFQSRGKAFRAEAEAELPELEAQAVTAAGGEVSFAGEMHFLTH
ncbi:hypothetical protein [Longimicrobium sp.]|uniref:hypothetical protein n=1 Tax=Longimicrobium sp. TaxID=2029185 RepID=UPI002E33A240|nr:hypothetical protein [Longimicrobium sp.]HEX6038045.1 hypothetical protein [Longimicrobium sp.]